MSTIIKVRCTDQVLTYENTPVIASGGLEEDFVSFEFCSKWDGLVKTAVFWRSEKDAYHVLLEEDDTCPIPPEVLAVEGVIYFGVFGVSETGKQRTSEVLRYNIVKGAITEDSKPSDPTPDIYTQILAEFLRFENEITARMDEFTQNITTAWYEYQTAMGERQNEFENAVTNRQTDFETAMNNRQDEYESDINKQWQNFKTGGDFVLKTDYEKDFGELRQQVDGFGNLVDLSALSPAGAGFLYVYCKDEAGKPVSGCVVTIGEDLAVTKESGVVKYILEPGTYSATVRSPIDYGAETKTVNVTIALSEATTVEVTIDDSLDGATELRFTKSVVAAFSGRVESAYVFCVGGGGSGGAVSVWSASNYLAAGACGGAGGKTITAELNEISAVLVASVGSGGGAKTTTGVQLAGSTKKGIDGAAGGTTSVKTFSGAVIASAEGGEGGASGEGSVQSSAVIKITGASGGSGSGAARLVLNNAVIGASGVDGADGGAAGAVLGGSGQNTTTRAFGESDGEVFSPAGGSAGIAYNTSSKFGIGEVGDNASVGVVGDATGGNQTATPSNTPGAGGGAAAIFAKSTEGLIATSAAGANGLIIFRWEVSA